MGSRMILDDILQTKEAVEAINISILSDAPFLCRVVGLGNFFFFPVDQGKFIPYEQVFVAWVSPTRKAYGMNEGVTEKIRKYFAPYKHSDQIHAMISNMKKEDYYVERIVTIHLIP